MRLYFDYLSPYAYLGWRAARADPRLADATPVPVLFAGLLQAHGQLGPAEMPAKRAFVARDCLRAARRLGVPLTYPETHPFRPLDALRLSVAEVAGADQARVVDALFHAGWALGRDLANPEHLVAALDVAGLDGEALLAAARGPEAKAALRHDTEAAIAAGVFGVPTFQVGDALVWGHDRLDDVRGLLDGTDPVDDATVDAILARAPGAVRRRRPPDDATVPPRETGPGWVQRMFDAAPFVQHLGITLDRVEDGVVETHLDVRPEMLQHNGFVHAGVITALADHSAGAAAGTRSTPGTGTLTVEFKVNLMRPGTPPRLDCRAVVLRSGRRLAVSEAEVRDVEGRLVAKLLATMAYAESGT